jgi:minor histocompatibility antigen H13
MIIFYFFQVTVAKGFDAPVKIIFPTAFDPWKHAILGLGDIVIPGIFVAICLRFDFYRSKSNSLKPKNDILADDYPKPYFITVKR